jgi:sterol desaturase/sphingolipid hydroxylase (fatty acid hydroxylase superfamily)
MGSIVRPMAIGIIFMMAYIAEQLFPQRKELLTNRHDLKNILVGLINLIFTFFSGYYLQKLMVYTATRKIGLEVFSQMPLVWSIILQILFIDLFVYCWHRVNHAVPLLWKFHKFHHEDDSMNSTTAVRFHTVELLFSVVVKAIIFPFIGITVTGLVAYGILFFPVVLLVHSNIRISKKTDYLLRRLIVSPWMHRIHHSNVIVETDSNYGSVFPFWDMLFRSYRKKPIGAIKFGV